MITDLNECDFCLDFRLRVLAKLKWRKSCSGFRSRRAGLRPAFDMPGHCPDSMRTWKHSKSGSTLYKKGSGS